MLSTQFISAKPTVTKSRRQIPQNVAFMECEVTGMLADGISQVSTTPWRAQAFVVRNGRMLRMVIDCSQTTIRHTSKNVFLFPNMQDLLDQAVKNTIFFENRFEICVSSDPTSSQGHVIHCVRSKRTSF